MPVVYYASRISCQSNIFSGCLFCQLYIMPVVYCASSIPCWEFIVHIEGLFVYCLAGMCHWWFRLPGVCCIGGVCCGSYLWVAYVACWLVPAIYVLLIYPVGCIFCWISAEARHIGTILQYSSLAICYFSGQPR